MSLNKKWTEIRKVTVRNRKPINLIKGIICRKHLSFDNSSKCDRKRIKCHDYCYHMTDNIGTKTRYNTDWHINMNNHFQITNTMHNSIDINIRIADTGVGIAELHTFLSLQ